MRKVELNTLEQNKYEIIKNLVDNGGNIKRAAIKLNVTVRHIYRLIEIYKTEGKAGFLHGNNGKKNNRAFGDELKTTIIELYKTKYEGANITHFRELLERNENIKISYAPLYNILRSNSLLSPRVQKKTISNEQKKIKLAKQNKEKLTEGQKDLVVKNNILSKYDAHSRIPRLKYFGECLEMDASKESWFGDTKTTLHGAIDNSTGTVCGLYFDTEETLNGYYHLFERIWLKYGVPAKFKTDNRTVFIYKGLKDKSLEKDTLTQFGYACNQLGVDLETTSIPEEKSRIERLWETLQGRLPIELRLAGIKTIEEANKFLEDYTTRFNEQFALPIDYSTSLFEKINISAINTTLSIITKRKFDKGCSIKFEGKVYLAYRYGRQINYAPKTSCLVIKTFDGKLLCNVDNELSELRELSQFVDVSKNFDLIKEESKKFKKVYIPQMTHPWKQESFMRYLAKNKRTAENAYV